MTDPSELSLRFARERLAPALPPAGDEVELLAPEAARPAHRIVELWGDAPFDASVAWSAGTSRPKEAVVSVSRATRIGVFARTLVVKVRNLASVEQSVSLAVSDGFLISRNTRQRTGTGNAAFQGLEVPAYAETMGLHLADPAQLPAARIALEDGFGVRGAIVAGDAQGAHGVPIGAADKVFVLVPGGVPWRAVFHLSL
jgi:hypothetical protein